MSRVKQHFNWKSKPVSEMSDFDKIKFVAELFTLSSYALNGKLDAYKTMIETFPSDVMELTDPGTYKSLAFPDDLVMFPLTGETDPELAAVYYPCEHCCEKYLFPEG